MERTALQRDEAELWALWAMMFASDSPPSFIDWFFKNRFVRDYSIVCEEDGKVVACVHSLPCHMYLRGRILRAAILCGVATHPDYRGRGIMRRLLHLLEEKLRDRGVSLIIHRPENLAVYVSAGHFPVSDFKYLSYNQTPSAANRSACEEVKIADMLSPLYTCYAQYAQRYSMMIARSYADFSLKCADYLSCDAKCIVRSENGVIRGYSIFFENEESIFGEEFVADGEETYAALFAGMQHRAAGKKLSLRMASDVALAPDGAECAILPRAVLGACDVSPVLASLGLCGGCIEIVDPFLKENEGIYDLSGKRINAQPQLRIESGRLLQWAAGYRSLSELAAEGNAQILDPQIVGKMDALGKCPCYVIDEY